ncbi:MAG: DnaB-like helicase N-terminal domain-containing protein, partial [Lacipirellulaceae bacterium]
MTTPNSLLAPDAERALVASLLFDPERLAEVAPIVRPADLADPALAVILGVLLERHASGKPVEVPAVVSEVRRKMPDERDAKDVLVSLSQEAVSGLHAASYARDVAAAAERRRLRDTLREATALVERGADPAVVRSLVDRAGPVEAPRREPPPPWAPFPTGALPEPLRSLVVEGAKSIGCDESFVALPGLAAAAGAIGATRVLRLKR